MPKLSMPEPKKIKVCDTLPVLGSVVSELSPDELSKKLEFEYAEQLTASADAFASLASSPLRQDPHYTADFLQQQYQKYCENPGDNLIIGKVDDTVGYAVFAAEDIRAGTILAVYTGEIQPRAEVSGDDDYLMACGERKLYMISARRQAGLARFFPHMPIDHIRYGQLQKKRFEDNDYATHYMLRNVFNQKEYTEEDMEAMVGRAMKTSYFSDLVDSRCGLNVKENPEFQLYDTPPTIKELTATQNISQVHLMVDRWPIVALIADFPIKRHEIVGFSYGKEYWENTGRYPHLLTRYGEVIHPSDYSIKQASLKLATPPLSLEHCVMQLTQEQCRTNVQDVSYLTAVHPDGRKSHVSIYDCRKEASNAGLLPAYSYAQLPDNSFARILIGLAMQKEPKLPSTTRISVYYQKPWLVDRCLDRYLNGGELSSATANEFSVDVVIQSTPKDYAAVIKFFGPYKGNTEFIEATHEFVVKDVNNPEVHPRLNAFIRTLGK